MNKILIPTDFSAEAAETLKKLCAASNSEFDILFTHLFYLPDGIQDLLFGTYRVREYKFVTEEFRKVYFDCVKGRSVFAKRTDLPVKFFYGNTLSFFRNFLSANQITSIAYSSRYEIKQLNSSSIKPSSVIFKCKLPVLDVEQKEIFIQQK